MKVILDEEDIKNLINITYKGVTEISMPDKLEITINIDSNSLKRQNELPETKTGKLVTPSVELNKPKKELSTDEKNDIAKAKGLMAGGGQERVMARF